MTRLAHYFAPFQAFVIRCSEEDESRFEQLTALRILELEARYRARSPGMAGLFIYQLECIARNRLGYTDGLKAMSDDPLYSDDWRRWILRLQSELGTLELAELIYRVSEHFYTRRATGRSKQADADRGLVLFGEQEGRIAAPTSAAILCTCLPPCSGTWAIRPFRNPWSTTTTNACRKHWKCGCRKLNRS